MPLKEWIVPLTAIAMMLSIIVSIGVLVGPASIVGSHPETYKIWHGATLVCEVEGNIIMPEEVISEGTLAITEATLTFDFTNSDLSSTELLTIAIDYEYYFKFYLGTSEQDKFKFKESQLNAGRITASMVSNNIAISILIPPTATLPTGTIPPGHFVWAELNVIGNYEFGIATPSTGTWGPDRIGYAVAEVITQEGPPDAPNVATPLGVVSDSSSRMGLIGVTVTSSDGNTTTTDSRGVFEIGVTIEPYDLTFTLEGYDALVERNMTGSRRMSIQMDKAATDDQTDTDTDGDGWSDQDEIDRGTDPTDPNDFPSTDILTWFIILIIIIIAIVISIFVLLGLGPTLMSIIITIIIWVIAGIVSFLLWSGSWMVI